MRRALLTLASVSTMLAIASGTAWGHGGGGGGGGHGGGGGGHGGGFGGGHGGGYGGGHGGGFYGGGGGYGGHHMGGMSGGGLSPGYIGGSGMHHSGNLGGMNLGGSNLGGAAHHGGLSGSAAHHGGLSGAATHHHGTGQQPTFVNNHVHHTGQAGQSTHSHLAHHSGNWNANHQHHQANYWRHRSFFFGFYSPFGFYLGYPWWGPGYGYRWGSGYGYYGGYGGYGYGYGNPYYSSYQPVCAYYGYGAPATAAVAVQDQNAPPSDQLENSLDYAGQGELDFKAGKYPQAVQNWRHALVDDPRNGAITLLLGQALFAEGEYDQAAGATQSALQNLPQDKWGTVITHYKELYPNIQVYTDQLRKMEKARDAKPDDAAIHFLLGYHFGYLGYPKQAVRELKKVLELAPKDELAKKLLDEFSAKLNPADKPAAADDKPADKPPEKSADDQAVPETEA